MAEVDVVDEIAPELLVQLYSKLSAAVSVSGVVGARDQGLLSLQTVGQYIVPNLHIDEPETQYYLANALDGALACDWRLSRKPGTISSIYRSILDGKEMPIVELTREQRDQLRAAQNLLFVEGEPSTTYQQYRIHQLGYLEALDAYEAAVATSKNGGPPVPDDLRTTLDERRREWAEHGHRDDVDDALAVVGEYEALEPARYWSALKERYQRYTRVAPGDCEFQFVTCLPPYERWFEEFGWSDFTFDHLDYENQPRGGGIGWQAGRCCCCPDDPPGQVLPPPPTSATAAAPRVDLRSLLESDVITSIRLSCRLRRVEIVRPWMDTNVFGSRAWRWAPSSVSYGVQISSGGTLAGSVVPTGVMPILPVTAILARDVDVTFDDDSAGAAVDAARARLPDGAELTFGPFRLSRGGVTSVSFGGHIYSPDPQLIGMISAVLPRCPRPDSTLNWPVYLDAARHEEWP